MKFEYRVLVEDHGFTYCGNGIDLDTLVRSLLEEINPSRITIEVEPLTQVAEPIVIIRAERREKVK